MNYEIIKDIKLLEDFIVWLPELQVNECFYLCLFARSKYAKNENGINKFPHIKTDKAQLKRFLVSNKKLMINKIKQLEVAVGAYKTKDGDDIPQESLALYITPNPRNQYRALITCMKKFCDIIEAKSTNFNIQQEAMSAIQKSNSRKIYLDFDFDDKPLEFLKQNISSALNTNAVKYLKTRSGYHVLVELDKIQEEYKKTWYNKIMKLNPDLTGDNQMIPVVGCTQGNFIPKFVL